MKRLSFILLFTGIISAAVAQNTKWAQAFGGANGDVITGVAEDASGNTYITGWYATSTTIGTNNFTSKGGNDLFLAKLDTGGNVLWAVSEGGTGDDRGYGVVLDGSGNVIVCGQFSSNFTFGSGANAKAITSAGSTDILVAGYSSAGSFLNIITAGGTNGDRANALSSDGNGNFAVTGYFGAPAGGGGGGGGGMGGGTATFGSLSITSVGTQDAFVAAMNSTTGWLWVNGYGSQRGSEVGNDITLSGGNIYVAGSFGDTTNFGGNIRIASPNFNDAFILKLNNSGTVAAVVQGGSTATDAANGITADGNGNIYVAGSFGVVGRGAGTAVTFQISGNTLSGTGSEAFTAAFDGNLGIQWAKSYGSNNAEAFSRISFGNGGLIVGGTFATSTTIGNVSLTAAGGNDAIAASLDTAGNVYWALAMGATNTEDCRRVWADANGRMFFAGSFNGPTGGGGGGGGTPAAQFGSATLTPAGSTDGYLVQFYTCSGLSQKVVANGPTNFCQSGSVRLTASAGAATYQWYVNGNLISGASYDTITVSAAGTYYCAMTNTLGCAMNSGNTTINIGTPPSASLSATSNSICQGDSVMLTATAGSGYKYKFYQNNNAISGWINSATFYAKTAGDYKVEIDNYGCTDMSTAITLTVTAAPTLAIQAMGTTTFCAGDSVLLKGDTNSTWFYQWQRQVGGTWNMVQNANADTLWAKQNGNYRLVITTLSGCNVSSNVIALNVGGTANATLQGFPGSATHCKGDSVTLGIGTGGGGGGFGLQYRWMKDGDTIPGVTTRNYVIKSSGTYRGVVLNGACKASTRDTMLVFINSSAQITPAPAVNLCTNDTIIFRASADPGSTFAWSLNGVAINGANDSLLAATAGGDYTCSISLSTCKYTTPATKVTLYPAATVPAIVQNGNNMGCSITATSYQWYMNNAPIPGATSQFLYGFSNGFYMVEITDANGCKARSPLFSFTYTANGITTLEVNKLNLFPNPSSGSFTYFIAGDVKVSVQVFNMEGKQVFADLYESVTGNQTLDLSRLENGMYIVRINYNDRYYIDRVQVIK